MAEKDKSFLRGALLGAALAVGGMAYREHRNRTHPLRSSAQRRINAALQRTLLKARQQSRLSLESTSKFVVFSDHHKGSRDGGDDFLPCEPTYLAALDYYLKQGYTLVLLGDVEELWENDIRWVLQSYANVFAAEREFYPQRYIRIVGNHDDAWNNPILVAQHLEPLYPGIHMHQALVLEYKDTLPSGEAESGKAGEIFLAHGHQGTLASEAFANITPYFMPWYRRLQNITGIGHTTPAQSSAMRSQHDTQMYRWASQQDRLILIAGHTHRPVWTSLTYLDQLYMQMYALSLYRERLSPAEFDQQRQRLQSEIDWHEQSSQPEYETLKTRPSYFNTGCCRYRNGDITGIEITGREIGLVKWSRPTLERQILNSMALQDLFARL